MNYELIAPACWLLALSCASVAVLAFAWKYPIQIARGRYVRKGIRCFWQDCKRAAVEVHGTRFTFCEEHCEWKTVRPKRVDVKFNREVEARFDFKEASPGDVKGGLQWKCIASVIAAVPDIFSSLDHKLNRGELKVDDWVRLKSTGTLWKVDLVPDLDYSPFGPMVVQMIGREGMRCVAPVRDFWNRFEKALPRKGEWWMHTIPQRGASAPYHIDCDWERNNCEPFACYMTPINFGRGEQSSDPTRKTDSGTGDPVLSGHISFRGSSTAESKSSKRSDSPPRGSDKFKRRDWVRPRGVSDYWDGHLFMVEGYMEKWEDRFVRVTGWAGSPGGKWELREDAGFYEGSLELALPREGEFWRDIPCGFPSHESSMGSCEFEALANWSQPINMERVRCGCLVPVRFGKAVHPVEVAMDEAWRRTMNPEKLSIPPVCKIAPVKFGVNRDVPKFKPGDWVRGKISDRLFQVTPDGLYLKSEVGMISDLESQLPLLERALPRKGEWWMCAGPDRCSGCLGGDGWKVSYDWGSADWGSAFDHTSLQPVNFGKGNA